MRATQRGRCRRLEGVRGGSGQSGHGMTTFSGYSSQQIILCTQSVTGHSNWFYINPVSPDSTNSQLSTTSDKYDHDPITALPSYCIKIE